MQRVLWGICLILLAGCGKAEPGLKMYPVSGTVSYQGEPLTEGRIAFVPIQEVAGGGPPIALDIRNGKFSGECTAGLKKVEIYGSWPTGKMLPMDDGSGDYPERESIPDQHNAQSNLQITLEEAGNANLNFDLK